MAQAPELGAVGGETLTEEEFVEEFLEKARQAEEKEEFYLALFNADKALKLVEKTEGKNSSKYKKIQSDKKRLQRKAKDESDEDDQGSSQSLHHVLSLVTKEDWRSLATRRIPEADSHLEQREYAKAADKYQEAINFMGEDDPEQLLKAYIKKAQAHFKGGKMKESVETMHEAERKLSSQPLMTKLRVLYFLAYLYNQWDKTDKEKDMLQRALQLATPNNDGPQRYIGILYRNLSDVYGRLENTELMEHYQWEAEKHHKRERLLRAESIDRVIESLEVYFTLNAEHPENLASGPPTRSLGSYHSSLLAQSAPGVQERSNPPLPELQPQGVPVDYHVQVPGAQDASILCPPELPDESVSGVGDPGTDRYESPGVAESSTLEELVRKLLTSELSTCNAEDSIFLANNRYTKKGEELVKEKKYAEAVQSFASAVSHQFAANANHDMILDNCWNLAETVMQDGRLHEAQKLLEATLEYFSPLTSPVWKLRMLYLLACLSALLGDRDKEYQCYDIIARMLKIRTGFAESGEAFLCAAVSAAYRNGDVDLSLEFRERARTYDNRGAEIRQAEEIDRFLRSFERVEESRRASQIAEMLRFIEEYLPQRPIAVSDSSIDQRTLSWTASPSSQQSSYQSSLPSSHEEQLRSNTADGGIRQPAPGLPSTEAGIFMDDLESPGEDRQPTVNRPVQDALSGLMENLTELRDLLPADILSQEREMDNSAEEVSERIGQLSLKDASEEQISHMQPTTVAQDVVFKNEKTNVRAHSDEKIEEINQDAGAAQKLMPKARAYP